MARRGGEKHRKDTKGDRSSRVSEDSDGESHTRLRGEIVVVSLLSAAVSPGMRTYVRNQRRRDLRSGQESRGETVAVRKRQSERRRLRSREYFKRRCSWALHLVSF